MHKQGKDIKMTVNNLSVCYNDEGPGDAPVIIFIHGFPFNKSMWNAQVEALENNYRVISYDIRGHGGSDEGEEVFSIELFVDDLLRLMDALKIKNTMLCGLSLGGYIALNAVEHYPKRFNSLILCDTNCSADTPEAKVKRTKAIVGISKNGLEKYADESVNNLFAPESFSTIKEEIAEVRAMILKTSKESVCNTLHALSVRLETCDTLPDIKVPVLILVGKKDKITPPSAAQLMHEKIKGSILHIVNHSGHLSNIENPYDFNEQLRSFVESVYKKK
jgi:3-oxoadipate enol-lactonase